MDDQVTVIPQAGAIPYRHRVDRRIEILLLRRFDKKFWSIPKGIVDSGWTPEATAHNEALEEAGVVGTLSAAPITRFMFKKFGGLCAVEVYLLAVTEILDAYPEAAYRERRWFDTDAAGKRAKFAPVRAVIADLPGLLASAAAPAVDRGDGDLPSFTPTPLDPRQ